MLKILHTADWHLGNFPAPASKSKQNLRYLDICSYIEFLIHKAQSENPDIIIIAGDVFNQAKTWSDRGLQETNKIVEYVSLLSDIAPTCILRGTPNHDGKMHYDLLATALRNKPNIYIIDEPCVENVNGLAAIAFVPIFDRNQFRVDSNIPYDKEAENNYFSDKVRDTILDLKKEADTYGLPTILVTHYTVLGSVMPNGQQNVFATAETVIDPLTLSQSNYTLTCLGHIHKPQKLETAPNAYYSGSLCALTFNDENDKHGFYLHTIINTATVSSEFVETPDRKFHTIWFNEAQLNDIIASDYNIEKYIDEPMSGDIIRVIYSCSDTTNKALNKALLEKSLYETTNAFYVQEIVPAEIDITVNKSAMQNTDSISDNLHQYLCNEQQEHNSISNEQIIDCMTLAQPIIDSVLANKSNNRNIGVFTPIEIDVKNYRNYRNATFNYNDVKFCVVNGENGAGKSSLFMDAMLDALFEEPREGEITGWINNDINVRSGSIRFTFAIGSNIYRITRTRQKSGKATLNLAQLVAAEDGKRDWSDLSADKIKDTQAAINKLIGMNALTLKSCGLIMQDAYGLFLQADKNTRMDILGDILNLTIYDELTDAISLFNQNCQRDLQKLTDEENNITANLKDGDAIRDTLADAMKKTNEYEHQMTVCDNESLSLTVTKERLLRNSESYSRLTTDINNLTAKQQKLYLDIENQNAIISEAYQIASQESEYTTKTQRYDELAAQEKAMSEKAKQAEPLKSEKIRIEKDIAIINNAISDTTVKMQTLLQKQTDIKNELEHADEIANNAALYEKTKQEIAILEKQLVTLQNLETEHANKELQIINQTNAMDAFKAEYDNKFEEIARKEKFLAESGCPITDDASCRFLIDARTTVDAKTRVTDEYNRKLYDYIHILDALKTENTALANEITAVRTAVADIDEKKNLLTIYEHSAFKLASIAELKKMLVAYEQQYEDFSRIKIENIDRLSELSTRMQSIISQIDEITSEITEYERVKSELTAIGDITAWGNAIAAAKATISAAECRIKELQAELGALKIDIEAKVNEINGISVDITAINRVDADILACRARQDLLIKNIADNNKLIGRLEQELKQYQSDIRRLTKIKQLKTKTAYTASNADWLKKAFNRNGIPHNVIRSVIPILQTTASNILSQMSNNTMSIELKTEKVLTTKKEVATLDVIVCDTNTGNLPYLSRSGGERVKAALSVVLALAEIKSCETGTQFGFLFIDEPPFLDSNGIEAYCDALEAIQKRYSNLKIMAITHDPEMKSRFAQSVDVVKTANGSEIALNL